MEVSTPLRSSNQLRRRIVLKNTVNLSPLRRNNHASPNVSLLEDSNDETERLARRSNVEFQRRLSTITPERTPLNETYVKEQFLICSHLFTENVCIYRYLLEKVLINQLS